MQTGFYFTSGLFILYFPWIFPWDKKPLSGLDFYISYPHYGWIMWGFPTLTIAWVGLAFVLFGHGVFTKPLFPHFMGAFGGFFAIITNVFPLPEKRKYLYVYDKRARWVGLIQLIFAATFIYMFV